MVQHQPHALWVSHPFVTAGTPKVKVYHPFVTAGTLKVKVYHPFVTAGTPKRAEPDTAAMVPETGLPAPSWPRKTFSPARLDYESLSSCPSSF